MDYGDDRKRTTNHRLLIEGYRPKRILGSAVIDAEAQEEERARLTHGKRSFRENRNLG